MRIFKSAFPAGRSMLGRARRRAEGNWRSLFRPRPEAAAG
jgi:hypothetical protein